MFKRLSKWLVVVLLVVAMGGHWAFLQSVAWVSMAARFSQDSMLTVALEKTFDGQHPCGLCKLVQEGKSAEKKHAVVRADVKLDPFLVHTASRLYPPPTLELPTLQPDSLLTRAEAPPTPPPRLA